MKEKPVDTTLTSRIRQVFDNFEDPTAEDGWQELRKKFPKSNRRPIFLWIASTAAVLLIATSLWFVKNESNPVEKTALRKPITKQKGIVTDDKAQQANFDLDSTVISKKGLSAKLKVSRNLDYVQEIKEFPLADSMQETFSNRIINPVDLARLNLTVSESLTSAFDDKLSIATVTINESAVSLAPTILEDLPINKEINKPEIKRKRESDKTNRKEQKTAFSIFAGSYFNYAEGSEKQLNYSAGVTSDIRLSKNLKFSTGLNIASNSLSYGKSLPENASNSSDFGAIKAGAASVGNFTNLINYHANLLVLDFPVNIKYQFYPESDKFYVSAGLSSGTYLTESYVYQYINYNPTSGNYVSGPQNKKEKKQFNDFDLGRTLNFSLGLNTPFGKKQTISIEPFLKYPLGGLGSENLKFGSMGINLKFHFKPITKQ